MAARAWRARRATRTGTSRDMAARTARDLHLRNRSWKAAR